MAAAFFNQMANPQCAQAISAGTAPGESVHPIVVTAMQEVGIDLSQAKPQKLTDAMAQTAQMLITMGCGEACPHVPGIRREDWPLLDPKSLPLEEVRGIRDEIRNRVEALLKNEACL